MTTTTTRRLAILASKMMLTDLQTIALPAAIEVATRRMSMTEESFITKMEQIPELREYMASLCRRPEVVATCAEF